MNCKKIFCILFLLIISFSLFAKITEDDKKLSPQFLHGDKDAIIILKKIVVDDSYKKRLFRDTYYCKFKVFTKKGIENFKNKKIVYMPEKESIEDLKAVVWTPDGKIHRLRSAEVVEKEVLKKWGVKIREISFVFPSLVEGAVVEYSYSKTRKYIKKINHFFAQGTVYTKKCEFKFVAAPNSIWGYTGANLHQQPHVSENKKKRTVNIVFTDIPGLLEEEYSFPYSTLREQIVFYYASMEATPSYFWWVTATTFFDNQVERFLKPNDAVKNILENKIGIQDKDNEQILKDVYGYIVTHYKPLSMLSQSDIEKIDKRYLKKVTKGSLKVTKMIDFPYLQEFQINLLTLCFIKNAIPDAKISLGLYIPWDRGRLIKTLRNFSQFEEILLKVECGGKIYFLAPGKGILPFNFIPYGARNTDILFISKQKVRFEKIESLPAEEVVGKSIIDVTFSDERMTLNVKEILNFYDSYEVKSYALFFNEEQFKTFVEAVLRSEYGDEVKLIDYKIQNLKDYDKPFIMEYTFSYPYEFDELGDSLVFKPLLVPRYKSNPFIVNKRYSPIVFKYPQQQLSELTYHLPENIEIDTLPDSQSLSVLGFTYNTEYLKIDSQTFKIKVFQENKYSIYPPTVVYQFKKLFDGLINVSNPRIVLKEKK